MDVQDNSAGEERDALHDFAEKLRNDMRKDGLREDVVQALTDDFVKEVLKAVITGSQEAELLTIILKASLVFLVLACLVYFLLPQIFLVWAIALVATLPFLAPDIYSFFCNLHKYVPVDAAKVQAWGERTMAASLQRSVETAYDSTFGASIPSFIAKCLTLIFYAPPTLLQYGISRMNIKNYHRWPIKAEWAWEIIIIRIGFYLASSGMTASSISLSAFFFIAKAQRLAMMFFRIEYGRFSGRIMLSLLGRSLKLKPILWDGLVIVSVFAITYYSLSVYDDRMFSKPLGQIDSLYFSLITAATVGYGDIFPQGHVAKLTCMAEVAFGFVYVIFMLGTVISSWQSVHIDGNNSD